MEDKRALKDANQASSQVGVILTSLGRNFTLDKIGASGNDIRVKFDPSLVEGSKLKPSTLKNYLLALKKIISYLLTRGSDYFTADQAMMLAKRVKTRLASMGDKSKHRNDRKNSKMKVKTFIFKFYCIF